MSELSVAVLQVPELEKKLHKRNRLHMSTNRSGLPVLGSRLSTNRSGPNILVTFGRKTGGWGGRGVYYACPSLPISMKYVQEGVRIRVKMSQRKSEKC